jgi:uncharacterized protein YodC (DUF2158 family)
MSKTKFQIGDVVRLKSESSFSGGTNFKMTIKSLIGVYPDIQEIECIWLSKGGILQTQKFSPLLLEKPYP